MEAALVEPMAPQVLGPPSWLTIRVMDGGDIPKVATMLHEEPDALRDDYMVSLVADREGDILAVLRGWLGHPYGHIEAFNVDGMVSRKARLAAGTWLLLTFEGMLQEVSARGWTAMTAEVHEIMAKFLRSRGAKMLPGMYHVFVKRWR